jgi:polyisoprenoid-binding protein YceI
MSIVAERTATLPAGTWRIDATHSQVGFAVDYMVGTFRGSFSPVEAALEVAGDGTAALSGSARVEDVKVQDGNLVGHLLTPDFFDAERHPEIRFASSDVRRNGDDLTATGELTIKGVTAPVELKGTIGEPITDPYGNERIGLRLATTVDRTAFGVSWNLPLPNGTPALANEVELTAELYLVKAA